MREISVGTNLTPAVKTTVYTVPAGFYAICTFMQVVNHTGTNKNVDIAWFDFSLNTELTVLATYPLNSDQFVVVTDNNRRIVLEENDQVRITAEAASQMTSILTFELYRK